MGFRSFDTLTDPWWCQQPGESSNVYARFETYAKQQKGERSYAQVAESAGCSVNTVHKQAKAHRWADRVAQWDREDTEAHRERIGAKAEKLAEQEIGAAAEFLLAARRSVRYVLENNIILEPDQAVKAADAAIKLGKAASEAPQHVMRLVQAAEAHGPTATVDIDVPELADLPDQKLWRIDTRADYGPFATGEEVFSCPPLTLCSGVAGGRAEPDQHTTVIAGVWAAHLAGDPQ